EELTGSVVLALENGEGEKELAAYITGTRDLTGSELRDYLRDVLPDYMIPGHYIQLASFPLTSNGKLDRKNLPDAFGALLSINKVYVAARNETETRIISIWEAVLGKSGIGILDNFFELGGHSLKATRLSSMIQKEFDIKISLQEILATKNIEELAIVVSEYKEILKDNNRKSEIII
ncbi:phosphopantetheine-binding protein, partial [Chryseobacterium sp. NRRL B-14859]|uniref:phosphopantetheine-binding protein n=1 Tax=Chryseobacterium sp. NRRL B-14859 TaxID=1562763 RepID=UPI003396CD2A